MYKKKTIKIFPT